MQGQLVGEALSKARMDCLFHRSSATFEGRHRQNPKRNWPQPWEIVKVTINIRRGTIMKALDDAQHGRPAFVRQNYPVGTIDFRLQHDDSFGVQLFITVLQIAGSFTTMSTNQKRLMRYLRLLPRQQLKQLSPKGRCNFLAALATRPLFQPISRKHGSAQHSRAETITSTPPTRPRTTTAPGPHQSPSGHISQRATCLSLLTPMEAMT